MKSLLLIFSIIQSLCAYSQGISKINLDLNLSDSLSNNTEIRIYQSVGPTNYTSLFRMYELEKDKWTAEFYEHWSKVDGVMEMKSTKKILTSKSEMEYVYLNLCRSYIFELPSGKDIAWKLEERGPIEKVEIYRNKDGTSKEEWMHLGTRSMQLDGTGYRFQVKNSYKSNEFYFGNPDYYVQKYPEIDEPKYVSELIEIIKNEFGIWQD